MTQDVHLGTRLEMPPGSHLPNASGGDRQVLKKWYSIKYQVRELFRGESRIYYCQAYEKKLGEVIKQ